ncbi:MAG TPA: dTDP-4-dehydrorhamnose 3,5-epimerase [Saprospiraceae bacterium]|nr:dTDP-4-dehydrorhamnose 3,5-epimerase [Saprospiraceae bacterium]
MKIIATDFQDLLIVEPDVYLDERGYFSETFHLEKWGGIINSHPFVQDNESCSNYGVVRGLHFQVGNFAQSKLVRVIRGEVLDVVVDLRLNSTTYGKVFSILLSENNKRQLYVPRGFAHGYAVLKDQTIFCYKCDAFYSKENESGIFPLDPALGIDWIIPRSEMILSEKDMNWSVFQS